MQDSMKLSRLTGRKTCDRIRTKGYVWKGKTMIIRWLPCGGATWTEASRGLYVGTYAPGTLHKSAVKRNRMRRRCREALRMTMQKYTQVPPTQLLLCPRIASLGAPFPDICADITSFILFRLSHA